MMSPELHAEILRLYQVEKWRVGTISRHLTVHHETVKRVLCRDGLPPPQRVHSSRLDPYVGFIVQTWKQYPKLPASRLYEMCRQRDYSTRTCSQLEYVSTKWYSR